MAIRVLKSVPSAQSVVNKHIRVIRAIIRCIIFIQRCSSPLRGSCSNKFPDNYWQFVFKIYGQSVCKKHLVSK